MQVGGRPGAGKSLAVRILKSLLNIEATELHDGEPPSGFAVYITRENESAAPNGFAALIVNDKCPTILGQRLAEALKVSA